MKIQFFLERGQVKLDPIRHTPRSAMVSVYFCSPGRPRDLCQYLQGDLEKHLPRLEPRLPHGGVAALGGPGPPVHVCTVTPRRRDSPFSGARPPGKERHPGLASRSLASSPGLSFCSAHSQSPTVRWRTWAPPSGNPLSLCH